MMVMVPNRPILLTKLGLAMTMYHSRVGVTSRLRMRGHDYAAPASYLITLCTERRLSLFGAVVDGDMVPSPAGVVVDSWWHYLPARLPSVDLDVAVVMPNHFHAVVHLGTDPNLEEGSSLGDVVRWFKRRTTYDYTVGVKTEGWPRFPGRLWQQRFHERIIRDERGLERAREYVVGNPGKWADDEYYRR